MISKTRELVKRSAYFLAAAVFGPSALTFIIIAEKKT